MVTQSTKDESTEVYIYKREEDTAGAEVVVAVVVVVVGHHSTAERGPSRPGYGDTAASTSCPYPAGLGDE